ncbi:MAG: mercury methylation ferredoxin HgcB [Trichloromonadaceae bacterium]
MKGFRYLQGVTSLRYDRERCIGCGRCIEICPHAVFALTGDKAVVIDLDACIECGACARNCPPTAIKVDSGTGCASGLINEWLMERGLRPKSGGC